MGFLSYAQLDEYLKILIWCLWGKNRHGRELGALQSFWSLKKGARTFLQLDDYLKILIWCLWGEMGRRRGLGALQSFCPLKKGSRAVDLMQSRLEKKTTKQINTHLWSFFCQKYEIPHFCRWDIETFTIGFSDKLNLMVWFSLRLLNC